MFIYIYIYRGARNGIRLPESNYGRSWQLRDYRRLFLYIHGRYCAGLETAQASILQ